MDEKQKKQVLDQIQSIEKQLQSLKELVLETSAFTNKEPQQNTLSTDDPEEIITALFALAQHQYQEDEIPKALAKIVHSSISDHTIAYENFIRYSFKTFQGRWTDYLANRSDPSSFTVARKQENNRGELSELRLYLHVDHRSDTPITLKQDPSQSLEWKIFALSL